jgi:outer membrane protein, multidrug efflux system
MTFPSKPPDTAHPALRWLGLTGLALLLSGCASLRSPEPAAADTALPTTWTAAPASATASPADLARWWTRFEDPTLTTLVEQALLSNTSVQSAQAALAQARAQRDVQAAQLGP